MCLSDQLIIYYRLASISNDLINAYSVLPMAMVAINDIRSNVAGNVAAALAEENIDRCLYQYSNDVMSKAVSASYS